MDEHREAGQGKGMGTLFIEGYALAIAGEGGCASGTAATVVGVVVGVALFACVGGGGGGRVLLSVRRPADRRVVSV